MIKTQVTMMKFASISRPVCCCLVSFSKVEIYPLFLKAVTMGLYSKKVMDAFNPPFNKLNGRKEGVTIPQPLLLDTPYKVVLPNSSTAA